MENQGNCCTKVGNREARSGVGVGEEALHFRRQKCTVDRLMIRLSTFNEPGQDDDIIGDVSGSFTGHGQEQGQWQGQGQRQLFVRFIISAQYRTMWGLVEVA